MGTGVKAATKGLQSIHETLEEAELRDRLCVMGQVGEPTVRAPFLLIFSFLLLLLILLYNIVLVLPYIHMYPPQVYTCSQS